jgi:hypothetical protein
MNIKRFCAMLFLIFSHHATFAQFGPVIGIDVSLLLSLEKYSDIHGWEPVALYPFVGVQVGVFRLTGFGGAGLALTGTETSSGSSSEGSWKIWNFDKWYGSYSFGGNLELVFDSFLLGCGYGYEYFVPDIWHFENKATYSFIRAALGMNMDDESSMKLYYDYRFNDNGFKFGILFGSWTLFDGASYAPSPAPPPRPRPVPSPKPEEKPIDNAGTIYYSYNGTGYVYFSESVFYLCSNGQPVGYVENGVIYAFAGRVLGFYESPFIYSRSGNPVGANNPKSLGTDAVGKRAVIKADKQDLPPKEPRDSVRKPRLKNAYIGGSLRDVF